MTSQVGIVDYGAGNILSVAKAVDWLGADAVLVTTPEQVLSADRLILPGVGAAGEALTRLRQTGLDEALTEAVRVRGTPLLGICLGMQMLAEELLEFGTHRGLGWIPGRVVPLAQRVGPGVPIPHMGWNIATATDAGRPLLGGGKPEYFYFAHSYTLVDTDDEVIAARTEYGVSLVTALRFETVFATQFHPEKSQLAGERVLESFLNWSP